MAIGIIFVIVVICAVFIAIYKYISNTKRETQIKVEENSLKNEGFNIDNKVTDINNQFSLFIDDKNKKLIIYNLRTQTRKIFNYKDLISFELKENNNSIVSGRAGSAIVGGLLFGGLGSIAGASGSRKISETSCDSMILYIVVNDMKNPNIEIPLIDREIKKDSEEYDDCINKAQAIVSIMKLIIEQNKKEPLKSETRELREYKKLLDDGIITKEEFEKKKSEILNKK